MSSRLPAMWDLHRGMVHGGASAAEVGAKASPALCGEAGPSVAVLSTTEEPMDSGWPGSELKRAALRAWEASGASTMVLPLDGHNDLVVAVGTRDGIALFLGVQQASRGSEEQSG